MNKRAGYLIFVWSFLVNNHGKHHRSLLYELSYSPAKGIIPHALSDPKGRFLL